MAIQKPKPGRILVAVRVRESIQRYRDDSVGVRDILSGQLRSGGRPRHVGMEVKN